MSDWFPPESLPQTGEFDDAEDVSEGSERPLREGLPPTYRMRHDRHYVDELDARSPASLFQMVPTTQIRAPKAVDLEEVGPLVESVRKVGVLQPILIRRRDVGYEVIAGVRRFAAAAAVGLTELPCRIYTVGEQEARALAEADDLRFRVETGREMVQMQRSDVTLAETLAQISDSLRAATSCWGVSIDGPERPHTAAVRGIAQVELQRAMWLTEGLHVLAEEPAAEMRPLLLGSVLDRALSAMRPECRLSEVTLSENLSRSAVDATRVGSDRHADPRSRSEGDDPTSRSKRDRQLVEARERDGVRGASLARADSAFPCCQCAAEHPERGAETDGPWGDPATECGVRADGVVGPHTATSHVA